jgi:anti-anti-sigma factor
MNNKVSEAVLAVAGLEEFTAANAGVFRKQVCAALDGHSIVEVDLSRTKAMDCAGLGALIAVRNLAYSRHGGVRLVGVTPVVQRLFDVVRAGDLFEVVDAKAPEDNPFLNAPGLSFQPPLIPAYSPSDFSMLSASH